MQLYCSNTWLWELPITYLKNVLSFTIHHFVLVLNVAAGKAPMQSSVAEGGIPQKAVDGSTSTFFDLSTCSLTEVNILYFLFFSSLVFILVWKIPYFFNVFPLNHDVITSRIFNKLRMHGRLIITKQNCILYFLCGTNKLEMQLHIYLISKTVEWGTILLNTCIYATVSSQLMKVWKKRRMRSIYI